LIEYESRSFAKYEKNRTSNKRALIVSGRHAHKDHDK